MNRQNDAIREDLAQAGEVFQITPLLRKLDGYRIMACCAQRQVLGLERIPEQPLKVSAKTGRVVVISPSS